MSTLHIIKKINQGIKTLQKEGVIIEEFLNEGYYLDKVSYDIDEDIYLYHVKEIPSYYIQPVETRNRVARMDFAAEVIQEYIEELQGLEQYIQCADDRDYCISKIKYTNGNLLFMNESIMFMEARR